MHPADPPPDGIDASGEGAGEEPAVYLRLYVARSTPNSVRAERNLTAVLASLKHERVLRFLEVIDVFLQPRRAVTEGVIVTPTLIGLRGDKRIVLMGDLADRSQLEGVLAGLSED